MKSLLGLAFAMVLGATPAMAEDWVRIGAAKEGVVELDRDHISWGVSFVYSRVRITHPSEQRQPDGKPAYKVSELVRYDDCRGATGVYKVALLTADGKQVGETDYAAEDMMRIGKGTTSAKIAETVCSVERPRPLNADEALPVGPTDNGSWRFLGADDEGSEYYLETSAVEKLGDSEMVHFYSKMIARRDQKEAGFRYRYTFLERAIDCESDLMFMIQNDYYDRRGRPVLNLRVPIDDLAFDLIFPDTMDALVRDELCGPETRAASRQSDGTMVGTAWLGPKGYLVTAHHVVGAAKSVTLYQDGEVVGEATVVTSDPANDIAVLKPNLKGRNYSNISLASAPPSLGEDVFTLGYPSPDTMGQAIKMTSGEISSLAGNDADSNRTDDRRLMQISVPVQSGNSGGPVIDRSGRVVGIVISKQQMAGEDEIAQNVNFALKIGYVRAILDDLPDLGVLRQARTTGTVPQLVADLRTGVFLISTQPHEETSAAK